MEKGGVPLSSRSGYLFVLSEYNSHKGYIHIMLRVFGSLSLGIFSRSYGSGVKVTLLPMWLDTMIPQKSIFSSLLLSPFGQLG